MSFLELNGKSFLVMGVANRRSVAWSIGGLLEAEGARVIYSVRSEKRRQEASRLIGERPVVVCDVEREEEIERLPALIGDEPKLAGVVHSIAFADYRGGFRPFHETQRGQFLQATQISAFSLVEVARALRPVLDPEAAFVSIGISSTAVTAENYGYMAPIKAALEVCSRNLAKSFSHDSRIRFNTVNAGPLKTSASAGIPGYLENYLYAEKLTLRKQALQTSEVAKAAVFLLSPASSGINGQGIVVNAGMDFNYFDAEAVRKTVGG